jgi:hypothetical protein
MPASEQCRSVHLGVEGALAHLTRVSQCLCALRKLLQRHLEASPTPTNGRDAKAPVRSDPKSDERVGKTDVAADADGADVQQRRVGRAHGHRDRDPGDAPDSDQPHTNDFAIHRLVVWEAELVGLWQIGVNAVGF